MIDADLPPCYNNNVIYPDTLNAPIFQLKWEGTPSVGRGRYYAFNARE